MIIQYNTDKTINGDERHEEYFTALIEKELNRFSSQLSRIEAHVSDQNGKKEGVKDILCTLEARIEGRQPIAVSGKGDMVEKAVSGAVEKLKASLETIIGKTQNH